MVSSSDAYPQAIMTYCVNPTRNCESFKYKHISILIVVMAKHLQRHAPPIRHSVYQELDSIILTTTPEDKRNAQRIIKTKYITPGKT